MAVGNFGPLQGLTKLRPQDYVNYLKMISALNKNVRDPQFHATISAKERAYDKQMLAKIAVTWLKEMGYGTQPYLVVFHKDTGNNHVHLVTTRIDRNGLKIPADFEKRRAVKNINKVLGYDFGFQYKFSTRAQFLMILESAGYPGVDPNEQLIRDRIDHYKLDKSRAAGIKACLMHLKLNPDYKAVLKDQYQIELVFHAAEGKSPYGYTILDHQQKIAFKGSEVLSLKELLSVNAIPASQEKQHEHDNENLTTASNIKSIWIADDVDDQQIHGMRRRRQKKSRTNTR